MTLLIVSTSSPIASIAFFSGALVYAEERASFRQAGGVVLDMIRKSGVRMSDVEQFCADIGPGSFTGTRVGVTLAKTLAFANGAKCGAISAFDLMPSGSAIPARKGFYFLRENGKIKVVSDSDMSAEHGYGAAFATESFPLAKSARPEEIRSVEPFALVPEYVLEPSISTPKQPFRSEA